VINILLIAPNPTVSSGTIESAPGPAVALHALQGLTHTIPLIGMSEDMVAEGVVTSLARPGGNTAGISLLSPELDGKRQDILIEAVPGARRIAAMADANAAPPYHLQALEHAARSRGVELSIFRVSGPEGIMPSIDAAKASGVEALNFLATPLFAVPGSQNNRIVLDRVAAVRLPAILQFPEDSEAGALAGYGPRITDLYRQRKNCGASASRHQACRYSGAATGQVQAGDQSKGRKGDWS
jgi:putative ABC transport system substrate-binding protein